MWVYNLCNVKNVHGSTHTYTCTQRCCVYMVNIPREIYNTLLFKVCPKEGPVMKNYHTNLITYLQ